MTTPRSPLAALTLGLALASTLTLAGGCKASEKSQAPESASYAGGGYADATADAAAYDYDDDTYPEEEVAAAPAIRDESARSAKREMLASRSPGLAPGGMPAKAKPPAPASAEPKPEPGATPGDGAEPAAAPDPEDVARQIIYTAELRLAVFKVDEVMAEIEAITLKVGGYVQEMRAGKYILRIPAPRLRDVMDGVGGLGMVTQRTLQARDVTEEFFDLRTRIRVLRETQAQLIELLKRAANVEEALHVRQALDRVTMELEQALGRMRVLESLIGFSTLTVYVDERGPQNQIPSSNDPFPWVNSLGVEATEWN